MPSDEQLVHIVLDWEYATMHNMAVMRDNIEDGIFSDAYYVDMWEDRLEVEDKKVQGPFYCFNARLLTRDRLCGTNRLSTSRPRE